MALSLALSLAPIPGNTIEICLDTQISRFKKQGTVVSKASTKSISTTLYTSINVTGINQLSSANTSVSVVHSLVCQHTSINKPRSAGIRQHFSSDAVTTSSFFDATYAVFSQIRQPHAVRVRLGSLHVAPSHSGSLRVPMSSAWHVFPH